MPVSGRLNPSRFDNASKVPINRQVARDLRVSCMRRQCVMGDRWPTTDGQKLHKLSTFGSALKERTVGQSESGLSKPWIFKAGSEKRFHRILAAVEPKPLDQERDPLNIKIVELATSLAEADGSELHVVYVWPQWCGWKPRFS